MFLFSSPRVCVRSDLQTNYDPLHDRYFAPMDNPETGSLDACKFVAGRLAIAPDTFSGSR
jgi:hypothetical protein